MSGAGFDWTNSEAEQWGKENDTLVDDDEDITNVSTVDEDVEFNEDQWEDQSQDSIYAIRQAFLPLYDLKT